MLIGTTAERFVAPGVRAEAAEVERDVEATEADLVRELRELGERLGRVEAALARRHEQRSVAPRTIIKTVDGDLLVALAGGAIGAALAAIGFILLRLSAVPGEVERHDLRAAALDEDLERWVADDHRNLRQELNRIVNEHAARGLL